MEDGIRRLPEPVGSNCMYVYGEADCIGTGGFGWVFKATVTDSGNYVGDKIVAVKKIRFEIPDAKPPLGRSGDLPEELTKWRKLLHLRHENVVSIYKITCLHLDVKMAIMEIMMDFVAGGDLRGTIAGYRKNGKKLQQETVLNYALQLAKGLDYLHDRRIIHGDIKPENILVKRNSDSVDGEITLKIADLDNFIQLERTLTCSKDVNRLLGSVRYMSPEMLKRFSGESDDVVGRKTDLWSLGCLLHELFDCAFGVDYRELHKITERFRITDSTNSTFIAMKIIDGFIPFVSNSLPENLSAILHSCLMPDVNLRIGSCSLIGELQKCMLVDTVITVQWEMVDDIVDHESSAKQKEKANAVFDRNIGRMDSADSDPQTSDLSLSPFRVEDLEHATAPRIKIVLVGPLAGKTALIYAHEHNKFQDVFVPTVFDYYRCTVEVDKKKHELCVWDTASADGYDMLRPLAYPQTDVFLVCLAVDLVGFPPITWLQNYLDEIKLHCPGTPFVLVVTQVDLREHSDTMERLAKFGKKPLSSKEGIKLGIRVGAHSYVECSARTQEGVKRVFEEAVRVSLSRQGNNSEKRSAKKMCRLM